MNATTASVCLLLCYVLTGPVAVADNPPDTTVPTLMPSPEPRPAASSAWVSATAGCLGGAALGTVLPGIGNLIGCFVGGASAWWLRSEPAR